MFEIAELGTYSVSSMPAGNSDAIIKPSVDITLDASNIC